MQHHTRRGVIRQFLQPGILPRAVGFIADERMAEKLKMHADLVGAAGVNLCLNECGGVQSLEHVITCVRGAAGIVVARDHAFAVCRMPRDSGANFASVARDFAAQNRVVNFTDRTCGKLFGKLQVRFVVFGDDEAAAGFLVEPMNDAWSRDAADAAELPRAMMQQCVDQRVFLVSAAGWTTKPAGLFSTSNDLSSKRMSSGISSGCASAGLASGQ